MSTRLAHQTQKTAGISNGMRTCTIAVANPLTLNVQGGRITAGVGCLASYTPVAGDVVAVFRQDSSWTVLGKLS